MNEVRLIDANALKKALNANCDTLCPDKNTNWCEYCCPNNDFEDLIDNAPSVDPAIVLYEKGLKKARHGKYVIYDVDFLLDNLAREVNIMESARQWKAGKGNDND